MEYEIVVIREIDNEEREIYCYVEVEDAKGYLSESRLDHDKGEEIELTDDEESKVIHEAEQMYIEQFMAKSYEPEDYIEYNYEDRMGD